MLLSCLPRQKNDGTIMWPREIWNELKIAVTLKGFSWMREGSGKKSTEQTIEMEKFLHGKQPTFPSQLKMSRNGTQTLLRIYPCSTNIKRIF